MKREESSDQLDKMQLDKMQLQLDRMEAQIALLVSRGAGHS